MKQKFMRFFTFVMLIPAILLAACLNNAKSSPSPSRSEGPSAPAVIMARPSPTPSPSPSESPEVTYSVKTDYSQLTPYAPMEEIYTRLSEDFMPELVPSDDYGMLVPYVGEVIESWMGNFYHYGLMTKSGMIVTDAVYTGVYKESNFYILYQPVDYEKRFARCALDGSWVTPFDSEEIFCCDQVMLLVRDSSKNDIDVMDYSGNLLYNTKSIDGLVNLPPDTIYNPQDEMSFNSLEYSDGFITVLNEPDYIDQPPGICFYFEELTGRVMNTDYTQIKGFSGGFAAVEKDGLWGYIDTSFNQIIAPAYVAAGDFAEGKAIVTLLTSGEDAVIDAHGDILLTTKYDLTLFSAYYIAKDTDNQKTVIYDNNLNEVFKADGDDKLSTFLYSGFPAYSFVKNGKTTIITMDSATVISGSYEIYQMNDAFIYCRIAGKADNDLILKPDGTLMIKLKPDIDGYTSVQFASQNYLIVNHHKYNDDYSVSGNYLILDKSGNAVFTGEGTVNYDNDTGCFAVCAETYYAFMDTSGKYIFRISLQDSIPD